MLTKCATFEIERERSILECGTLASSFDQTMLHTLIHKSYTLKVLLIKHGLGLSSDNSGLNAPRFVHCPL